MATRLQLFVAVFSSLLTTHSFAQKTEGELITRTFKVDSATVFDYASRLTLGPSEGSTPILQQWLQTRFARAGIEFPESPFAATLPTEKAMFLNERTGELFVRATREDLQRIDRMLAAMQKPPLVELEVTFAETSTIEPPVPFRPLPRGLTNVSVYTEKEFRETFRRFENTAGVDILTVPKVITMSGRQARLSVEQSTPVLYQDPPKLPLDTSPDADPTPRNKRRLPFPPAFVPTEGLVFGAMKRPETK
jgi:hypothetical protein